MAKIVEMDSHNLLPTMSLLCKPGQFSLPSEVVRFPSEVSLPSEVVSH